MNKIELSRRTVIIVSSTILLVVLIPLTLLSFFFFRYGTTIMSLTGSHIKVKKTLYISIDSSVPLNAALDTKVTLPIEGDIGYSIPFHANLSVPIDTTLSVPIVNPVKVRVNHDLKIDQNVHIESELPIDTTIQTKVLGVHTDLPVKALVPISMPVALKDVVHIDEEMTVRAPDPILCAIKKELTVPVKYLFEGTLPVRDTISIPLKIDLPAQVTVRQKLPCTVEFDVYFDLEKGITVVQPED